MNLKILERNKIVQSVILKISTIGIYSENFHKYQSFFIK